MVNVKRLSEAKVANRTVLPHCLCSSLCTFHIQSSRFTPNINISTRVNRNDLGGLFCIDLLVHIFHIVQIISVEHQDCWDHFPSISMTWLIGTRTVSPVTKHRPKCTKRQILDVYDITI